MSRDFSEQVKSKNPGIRAWVWPLLSYSAWVMAAFYMVMIAAPVLFGIYVDVFGDPTRAGMSQNLVVIIANVVIYALLLGLIIGAPRLLLKKRTNKVTLGIARWPDFRDIWVSLVGVIIYFVGAYALFWLVATVVPGFDAAQEQDLGVSVLRPGAEMMIGFFLFVGFGPLIEELIFRGYLYGNLRRNRVPVWVAAIVVSALFGLAHGQWNVGLNVFVLSLLMVYAREKTGSIWAGVLMHMIKNGLAFYLLFVSGVIQ